LTFTSRNDLIHSILDVFINMKTLKELGEAAADRRRALGLRQHTVALQAGLSPESLSRFERGHSAEFGSRKLLAVLAVLGMELQFTEVGFSGSLDELRRERAKS
jgi:transcriptional regulator with XRE-family HTH domain